MKLRRENRRRGLPRVELELLLSAQSVSIPGLIHRSKMSSQIVDLHKKRELMKLQFHIADKCFDICVNNFRTREVDPVRPSPFFGPCASSSVTEDAMH